MPFLGLTGFIESKCKRYNWQHQIGTHQPVSTFVVVPSVSCALIVFRCCPDTSVDFLAFDNMYEWYYQVILWEGHKRFISQSLVVCHPNLLPPPPPPFPSVWVWSFLSDPGWAWCGLVPRVKLCSSFAAVLALVVDDCITYSNNCGLCCCALSILVLMIEWLGWGWG